MTESESELPPVRRIVTGRDEGGRAVVTMDGAAPNRQVCPLGTVSTLIWGSDETPAEIWAGEDFGARENVVQPPAMGSWLRVVEFPPGTPGACTAPTASITSCASMARSTWKWTTGSPST